MNASDELGRLNEQLRRELQEQCDAIRERKRQDQWEPLSADEWQRRAKAEALFNHFARERRQGKRVEQIVFSCVVLVIAVGLGLVLGAWVAVWGVGL